MKRRLGAVFFASTIVAGLGACGGSANSASSGTTASSLNSRGNATSPTIAAPTTSTGSDGIFGATAASFTVKDPSQGYAALVKVSWGPLRHATAQDVANAGSPGRKDHCGLNLQTDALMPFQLQMTNTTSRFNLADQGADLSVLDENSVYKGPTIWIFEHQAATTQCGQGLASLYSYSLAPGAKATVNGFVEFSSYYSPGSLSGGPSVLSQLALEVQSDLPWDTSLPNSGLLSFHAFSSNGTPEPLMPLMPGTVPPCGKGESCSNGP